MITPKNTTVLSTLKSTLLPENLPFPSSSTHVDYGIYTQPRVLNEDPICGVKAVKVCTQIAFVLYISFYFDKYLSNKLKDEGNSELLFWSFKILNIALGAYLAYGFHEIVDQNLYSRTCELA